MRNSINSIAYKISHMTDKNGDSKNSDEYKDCIFIPYVVKVGRGAILYSTDISKHEGLRTSVVEDVAFIHNMLVIQTKNTVYWLYAVKTDKEILL